MSYLGVLWRQQQIFCFSLNDGSPGNEYQGCLEILSSEQKCQKQKDMLRSTTRRQRTTHHLTFVNRREQRKGVRLLICLLCISFMLLMYACPAILKNGYQVLAPITSKVLPEQEREHEREAVPESEPEPEGNRELEAGPEREREGEREAVPKPEPEPELESEEERELEAEPEREREAVPESEVEPEEKLEAVPELEPEMRPEGELEPGPAGEPVQVSEPEPLQPEPQETANDKELEQELELQQSQTAQPQIFLCVVISADYSLDFLPYYLQYYLDLGIPASNFVPLVHTKHNDSDNLNRTLAILEEYRIKPKMIWHGVFDIRTKGVQRLLAMKDIPTSAWIVDSDDDELHEYPHNLFSLPQNHSHESPLIQLLRYCEAHNISVVCSFPPLSTLLPELIVALFYIGEGQIDR